MANTPTSESSDSAPDPLDSFEEASDSDTEFSPTSEFVPLLIGLVAIDELFRRHHVPRRGLVHLDVASDLSVQPIISGVCSYAIRHGEKVALIEIPPITPPEEESNYDGFDSEEFEDDDFACYCAHDLPELNELLFDLLHDPESPDHIVVSGVESLFHSDALSLEEPPVPFEGMDENWYRDVLDRATDPACPRSLPSASELCARLARVYLCQWLAGQGTVMRATTTSLWLVASQGVPSLADASVKTASQTKAKARTRKSGKAPNRATAQSPDPFYLTLRSLLDTYCDYTLRWATIDPVLDRKSDEIKLSIPVSLYTFSLLLDETRVLLPSNSERAAQSETVGAEEIAVDEDLEDSLGDVPARPNKFFA